MWYETWVSIAHSERCLPPVKNGYFHFVNNHHNYQRVAIPIMFLDSWGSNSGTACRWGSRWKCWIRMGLSETALSENRGIPPVMAISIENIMTICWNWVYPWVTYVQTNPDLAIQTVFLKWGCGGSHEFAKVLRLSGGSMQMPLPCQQRSPWGVQG